MGRTIPSVVKCNQCGRLSPVISRVPIYEGEPMFESAGALPRVKEISCKLDCSKCGIRVQVMPPLPKHIAGAE
jgi:hypothetical protein